MLTTWPTSIPNTGDIELKIGTLEGLYLSKSYEWKVLLFLTLLPVAAGTAFFWTYFTARWPSNAWIGGCISVAIAGILIGLMFWYRTQRKYFCFCAQGCAYAEKQAASPTCLPWAQVTSVRMEDEAYLKAEENTVLGVKYSETYEEAVRSWIRITSGGDEIKFKLSQFADRQEIVENILARTKETNIDLDHSKVETPELQQLKASGEKDFNLGKTTYYAGGVILVIIIVIIKIAVKANR